jgi:hypothetical protein
VLKLTLRTARNAVDELLLGYKARVPHLNEEVRRGSSSNTVALRDYCRAALALPYPVSMDALNALSRQHRGTPALNGAGVCGVCGLDVDATVTIHDVSTRLGDVDDVAICRGCTAKIVALFDSVDAGVVD